MFVERRDNTSSSTGRVSIFNLFVACCMHVVAVGIASNLSNGISSSDTSQMPYVPASIFAGHVSYPLAVYAKVQ